MAYEIERRPLGIGLAPEIQGTITVLSTTPYERLVQTKGGTFVFVLYYRAKDFNFKNSMYYKGILSYLQIVQSHPRFSNWFVTVYTDTVTLGILQEAFRFSEFPNLVLCVVDWPYYTDSDGLPEASVFRTLRFQCVELFPSQICCIRDADTLFQRVLRYCDDMTSFSSALGAWESHFVESWLHGDVLSKPIVLGTEISYGQQWHTNLPLKLALRAELYFNYSFTLSGQKQQYAYTAPYGIFAGFVNFSANKRPYAALWTQCVEYLVARYSMVRSRFENQYRRQISNRRIKGLTGAIEGKDERLMLFVVVPLYLKQCFFFTIQYLSENSTESYSSFPSVYVVESLNDSTTIVKKDIPTIKVCGFSTALLNPYYIDCILHEAVVGPFWKPDLEPLPIALDSNSNSNTNTNAVRELAFKNESMRLHDYFARDFGFFVVAYASWLSRFDSAKLTEYLQSRLQNTVKAIQGKYKQNIKEVFGWHHNETSNIMLNTVFSQIPAQNLESIEALENLFLQNAGLYSPEEEAAFQVRYEEEKKTIVNQQRKRKEKRLEQHAKDTEATRKQGELLRAQPSTVAPLGLGLGFGPRSDSGFRMRPGLLGGLSRRHRQKHRQRIRTRKQRK